MEENTQQEKNITEVPFSQVGGLQRVIKQLRMIVEASFKFKHLVQTQKIGILLHGKPGCGKTLLTRELSKTLGNCFFKVIQGPELLSKYFGDSEKNLRQAFKECADESEKRGLPSILFIDEIDALAPKREKSDNEFEIRFVAQFLTLMDGFSDRKNTIVIGTTNRPDAIDNALKRSDRFDKMIEIKPPDFNDRIQIFNIFFKKYSTFVKISNDISHEFIQQLCQEMDGYNGSDISGIFKESYEITKDRCFDIDEMGELRLLNELIMTKEDFLSSFKSYVPCYKRENTEN